MPPSYHRRNKRTASVRHRNILQRLGNSDIDIWPYSHGLETKEAAVAASRVTVSQLSEPPARAAGKIVGEGPDAAPELVRLLREEANAL